MTKYQITEQVAAIGEINITGNIIPPHWYKELTFENGKPHFVAIVLLSDIRYWYTPTEVRSEETGEVKGRKSKFKADFLQRSTKALAAQFGFTEKQVKDALRFLEENGFINRHFRTVRYGDGLVASNVQYIEIIPDTLKKLQKIPTYRPASPDPRTHKSEGQDLQGGTYTKTPPLTSPQSTKVNEGSMPSPCRKIKNPRDFLDTEIEKKYFDVLTSFVPVKGRKLIPKEVSWWIKDYGIEKVQTAVLVYRLRVEKCLKNKKLKVPDEMGAYVCWALKSGTQPENDVSKANKSFAEELAKEHTCLEITEKYVKIRSDTLRDELRYTIPSETFKPWLLDKLETSKIYAM